MALIDNLERMLADGQDTPLLRYSLGLEYLKADRLEEAEAQLRAALEGDPGYSAAWKLLGKALSARGRPAEAIEALHRGIAVAEERGDIQAAKEMKVFLRRAEKALRA